MLVWCTYLANNTIRKHLKDNTQKTTIFMKTVVSEKNLGQIVTSLQMIKFMVEWTMVEVLYPFGFQFIISQPHSIIFSFLFSYLFNFVEQIFNMVEVIEKLMRIIIDSFHQNKTQKLLTTMNTRRFVIRNYLEIYTIDVQLSNIQKCLWTFTFTSSFFFFFLFQCLGKLSNYLNITKK